MRLSNFDVEAHLPSSPNRRCTPAQHTSRPSDYLQVVFQKVHLRAQRGSKILLAFSLLHLRTTAQPLLWRRMLKEIARYSWDDFSDTMVMCRNGSQHVDHLIGFTSLAILSPSFVLELREVINLTSQRFCVMSQCTLEIFHLCRNQAWRELAPQEFEAWCV